MNIRKVLLVTAIPVLVGSVGFISLNQANAKPVNQIAQAPQPPNERPSGQRKRPKIDFATAATKLGVTEVQLKAALGVPANPPNPSSRSERPPRPDFKTAATKLGVTETQLKDALGVPANPPGRNGRRPRPDFKAAATKLGVHAQQN